MLIQPVTHIGCRCAPESVIAPDTSTRSKPPSIDNSAENCSINFSITMGYGCSSVIGPRVSYSDTLTLAVEFGSANLFGRCPIRSIDFKRSPDLSTQENVAGCQQTSNHRQSATIVDSGMSAFFLARRPVCRRGELYARYFRSTSVTLKMNRFRSSGIPAASDSPPLQATSYRSW